jgi:hypothetical protein
MMEEKIIPKIQFLCSKPDGGYEFVPGEKFGIKYDPNFVFDETKFKLPPKISEDYWIVDANKVD